MILASGKCEMKFALENFQVGGNDFHQSNGKAFAKRYRQIAPSSTITITLSTSAATLQALVTISDGQGASYFYLCVKNVVNQHLR